MIEVNGLCKSYGQKQVVDDMSMRAPDGALTYLLGPNGAGKSTMLRMVAGLCRPDAGEALIDGTRLRELPSPIASIGFSLSTDSMDPSLTAVRQLRWQAELGGVDAEQVHQLLDLVGLADAAAKKVGDFSLGMRQRLGIASALLGDPKNLVLDEPANGLDVDGILWLRDFLIYLAKQRGKTLLIASHGLPEVALTADRIVVIGRGRIRADLPAAKMIARGSGPRPLEDAYIGLTRKSVEYRSTVGAGGRQ